MEGLSFHVQSEGQLIHPTIQLQAHKLIEVDLHFEKVGLDSFIIFLVRHELEDPLL